MKRTITLVSLAVQFSQKARRHTGGQHYDRYDSWLMIVILHYSNIVNFWETSISHYASAMSTTETSEILSSLILSGNKNQRIVLMDMNGRETGGRDRRNHLMWRKLGTCKEVWVWEDLSSSDFIELVGKRLRIIA